MTATAVAPAAPQHRKWLRFRLDFIVGCVLGVFIVFFHQVPPFHLLVKVREDALDTLFRLRNGLVSPHLDAPFVFVDIDEATKADPAFQGALLPRDQIATLLRPILALSPRLIVVDIDFSLPGQGDEELRALLEQAAQGGTPIAIAHATRRSASGERSIVDAEIGEPGNPFFGSVALRRSADQVVRAFPLWVARCDEGRPTIEPSLPLLAGYLYKAGVDGAHILAEDLAPIGPQGCDGKAAARIEVRLSPFDRVIRSDRLEADSRIDFTIRANLPPGGRYGEVSDGAGGTRPILWRLPAKLLLDAAAGGGGLSRDIFAGSIVVVGGSFAEGRDQFMTPLGQMPGAMVLVNAIYTVLAHDGAVSEARWPVEVAAVVVQVFLVALAFAMLPATVASLVSTGVVLAGVAIVLDRYAQVWLAPVVPLAGITVHCWIERVRDFWAGRLV